MSVERIKAILLQEFFITKHSLEVIMDIFFFPMINVIVFGFISVFLSGASQKTSANYLLVGVVLWQIIYITQYSMSVSSLWNIWSKNLSNMFITPLSIQEYLTAHMFSGLVKGLMTFILFSLIAFFIFHLNILKIGGVNLILFYINLTLFAWSTGIAILGAIFRFGTRIQALAWGLIFLFQPLTAALFPVKILPYPLQILSYFFPPTFVFEAARNSFSTPGTNWQMISIALIENIVYFVLAIIFFNIMLKQSKDTGQFARNEG